MPQLIKNEERMEGTLPDPKALAYWCKCPRCFEIHIAASYNVAILGTDWHSKTCPFISPGGLYTKFSAFPIYNKRHKIFRQLSKEWQQKFLDAWDKRLKSLKEQEEACLQQDSQAKK